MAGMIQLTRIQDYFYITISTDIAGNQDYATIIRTKDLSGLIDTPCVESFCLFVINDIMRPVSDIGKGLRVQKAAVFLLKYQNSVLLRIVDQIYEAVAGQRMSPVDFIRHHMPLRERISMSVPLPYRTTSFISFPAIPALSGRI